MRIYYFDIQKNVTDFCNQQTVLSFMLTLHKERNTCSVVVRVSYLLLCTFMQFQCCGLADGDTGYKDWQENVYFNCSDSNPSVEKCSVPASCCKQQKVR